MSQTPTLPKPAAETVATLTEPWYARRSTYTAIAAVLMEAPNMVGLWAPLVTEHQAAALHAFALTLATITGILARQGGVNAAGRVAEGMNKN